MVDTVVATDVNEEVGFVSGRRLLEIGRAHV